ncbi:MAG: C13 family peptidase, partial [Dokdonella sp.]
IEALRNESTLVITAARADRTSFGCGSESDITFFGRALLANALNETTSIPVAFERARALVAQWEVEEAIDEHSEPQIATSPAIEAKLEEWRRTLGDAPAVPFSPSPRASTNGPQLAPEQMQSMD